MNAHTRWTIVQRQRTRKEGYSTTIVGVQGSEQGKLNHHFRTSTDIQGPRSNNRVMNIVLANVPLLIFQRLDLLPGSFISYESCGYGMDASPRAPFSATPSHQALMNSVYNGYLLREAKYG